jgi:hypothetical protein
MNPKDTLLALLKKQQEEKKQKEIASTLEVLITKLDGDTASLKGDKGDKGDSIKGDKGDTGSSGKDGYTPIKGKDYFDGKDGIDGLDGKDAEFDEDKIIEAVVTKIPKPKDGKDGKDVDPNTLKTFSDEVTYKLNKKIESLDVHRVLGIRQNGVQIGQANDLNFIGATVKNNSNQGVDITITAGTGSGPTLQTNGTPNGSQAVLNLIAGTNVTLTDNGTGGVTIASSGGSGSPSIGGTITSGTTGSVLFVNPTATIAQDNNNFYFQDNATTPTTLATNTVTALSVGTSGDFSGSDSINTYAQIDAYLPNSSITNTLTGFNTDGAFPGYTSSSSRGTGASPVILNTGDTVGGFSGWGYTGSSPTYQNLGGMMISAVGATANNLGGQIDFYTKADGGTLTKQMSIGPAGLVTITAGIVLGGIINSSGAGNSFFLGNLGVGTSSPATRLQVSGTDTSSSGASAVGVSITPTYNQTGTASATDFLINRTETAIGTGGQLFANFQVGGVSKFSVTSGGVVSAVGLITGNGGLTTGANPFITNFHAGAGATTSVTSNAGALFGSAVTVSYHAIFNASTGETVGVNGYGSNIIFGRSPFTMPVSGTVPLVANVVINPVGTITNGSAITIINSASLYIDGAGTGATNNYAFLVNNGNIGLSTAGQRILITEGTNSMVGQTTLVAGTIAITISGLTTVSRGFCQRVVSNNVALTVEYNCVCTANTLTITADVAGGTININDTSVLNYIVYN